MGDAPRLVCADEGEKRESGAHGVQFPIIRSDERRRNTFCVVNDTLMSFARPNDVGGMLSVNLRFRRFACHTTSVSGGAAAVMRGRYLP